MVEIINAKSDNNGRVVVHLYKQAIDVTDKLKDGEADINVYGKDYKVRVQDGKDINGVSKARRFKKIRK
ncbi:hypothetical protein IKF15_04590 [Candidatus Saccharibacteria bacterium]|nr:hypothetical protein [Candidatus Saccharibacteria bacterium]MBQ6127528.1 hypothetical protein [Candidatus Saccharibacteria bacterium]MBQ9017422.1 hypothetical protein [Candidatus Saccharibacteria bacterium]MBR3164538.1 hypothetical protein [Candidatus Saccharibacteria bacterium]